MSNAHWNNQLKDRTRAVVIKGEHYRIGDAPYPQRGYGFGGSEFTIKMKDTGEVIKTRDLWHQGTVPPEYRDRLPDSASFVKIIEVQYKN